MGDTLFGEEVIRRRYERGRRNLIDLYLPISDRWIVYDNSSVDAKLVAEYRIGQQIVVYEGEIFNLLRGE
ncbi:hypothetical protein [Tolypothrix sp. VBCCA 56010]|uniref:hypothetical protein n=1 Tax=Tolypothrix sp. VBCCA 56010 TaxID=3137731 RepID=UPI003D7DC9C1